MYNSDYIVGLPNGVYRQVWVQGWCYASLRLTNLVFEFGVIEVVKHDFLVGETGRRKVIWNETGCNKWFGFLRKYYLYVTCPLRRNNASADIAKRKREGTSVLLFL